MHVIQALNGNKCNAYFVSGKIKELKKRIFEREVYTLIDIEYRQIGTSLKRITPR